MIKSNTLLATKDLIFIHILAILKIKPLTSDYTYKIESAISSEMLGKYKNIQQYFNFLHQEFIDFILILDFILLIKKNGKHKRINV